MNRAARGLRGVVRLLRAARDWFCDHWNCKPLQTVTDEFRQAVHDLRLAAEMPRAVANHGRRHDDKAARRAD